MVHPEADLIEYLIAQSKREMKVLPAVIVTRETADAIDASNIMRLSADQIDALLQAEAA
jgi:hypothetical protein